MGHSRGSAKRRLADALLEDGLSEFVSQHRRAGDSWRDITLALREQIDLDIHPETLRLWFAEAAA